MQSAFTGLSWVGVALTSLSGATLVTQTLLRNVYLTADTAASIGILGVSLILLPQFAKAYAKSLVNR